MATSINWYRGLTLLAHELGRNNWLVIDSPPALAGHFPVSCICTALDYALWRLLPPESRLSFGAIESASMAPDNILLFQPRSHQRLDWLLNRLARTHPGSRLVVAGANHGGGKVAGKHMRAVCSQPQRLSNRGRISLWSGLIDLEPPACEAWTVFTHNGLELHALPGVFGDLSVDAGTDLLLQQLDVLQPTGRILDFGCGTGILGLKILALAGSATATHLTFIDNDAPSLESTRRTLEANGHTGTVQPADGLDEAQGRYDWIVANPPFHRFGRPDLATVESLIRTAPARLRRDGTLLLVANRHLPLERSLKAAFAKCSELTENSRFKVLSAREPRAPSSV